jgi:hypothetical protein
MPHRCEKMESLGIIQASSKANCEAAEMPRSFRIGSTMDTLCVLYAEHMDTLIFPRCVKDKDGISGQRAVFSV